MQPDNRLLTNLIKCEKEHHSALLALLVRSHTSLAALSAYASTAAPPVAHALLGCIQAFAAADEGLRGYAAAVEGWKEELKEVRRVEDELKAVVRDKDVLVGRLIKASKQKIPTASLQAGPAPIPNASYLAPASPSSSSFSLPASGQQYGAAGYQYTPTPHATQHINAKLALAQRELHACEAHLAGKEAELAEVRRSAMTEGMARRCRAMAEVGVLWRERGEQGLNALDDLGREAAGAPPPVQPTYTTPRRSFSSHSGSSIAPSHSASQQQHHNRTRSASPFGLPRSTSPFGTYQTLAGGYQHSHPLPALPERDSWHGETSREEYESREREGRERPASYHPGGSYTETPHPSSSFHHDSNRPVSFHPGPTSSLGDHSDRRPVSSLGLGPPPHVELDIPPAHSIGDHGGDIIPLGRSVSSTGFNAEQGGGGWGSRDRERWGDDSSDEAEGYRVIENERWRGGARGDQGGAGGEEEIDPEILRAVEKMGMVVPPKDKPVRAHPPTPPETASSVTSPPQLPDVRVIEATPQKKTKSKARGADGERVKRKSTRRKQGEEQAVESSAPPPATTAPVEPKATLAYPEPKPAPTPTSSAASPAPGARPAVEQVVAPPSPTARASPDLPAIPAPVPTSPTAQAPDVPTSTSSVVEPQAPPLLPSSSSFNPEAATKPHPDVASHLEPTTPPRTSLESGDPVGSAAPDHDDVIATGDDKSGEDEEQEKGGPTITGSEAPVGTLTEAVLPTTGAVPDLPLETTTAPTTTTTPTSATSPILAPAPMPLVKPRPSVDQARAPTPTAPKPRAPKSRITSSASEPLVLDPARANSKANPKRRVTSGLESAGETSGTDRGARKKAPTKRKNAPTPKRQPSTEGRAGLAAMLRDSEAPSPHVHFPAAGGMYVPSAPPAAKQPGALFLPTSGGGGGTTRSDIGPARSAHFDTGSSALPPPSPVSATRGRSGSGSVSFFGRVAGLFGRKKPSGDGYISSGGGGAWRTRTDAHLSRGGRGDDSSDDEPRAGLVAVSNVNTPAGRMVAVDNKPAPDSPKRGLGRKLTKADRGQTLRVGPPPIDTDTTAQNRKVSLTGADREERFEVASPVGGGGKGKKSKGGKVRSVDGEGLSRKGSLKSTASEAVSTGSGRVGRDVGKKREPASLMALVEGPGLVLPSELAQRSESPVPPTRRTDSPARGQSPARSQSPQSLLSVPPMRMVSPTTTAAPKPLHAALSTPLKSALRRTPSPMPPSPIVPSSPQVSSPVAMSPTTQLSVPPIKVDISSPRNSIAGESVYETGEEDFEDATDGEGSDATVARDDDAPKPTTTSPAPAHSSIPPAPAHASAASPSAGTALAAFKSTIASPSSDATMSVSTAGPYSSGGTQSARRKSVRINPDPPEVSATPAATPAMELDEEPKWSPERKEKSGGSGGWTSRIGRGWEDSSEESSEDEEYERVRRALATSYKHLDAVNGGAGAPGKEKEKGKKRR